MTFQPPLYDINNFASWKSFLDEHGYVVLQNILNKEEVKMGLELFKKDMSQISSNFNLDDPSTFQIENTPLMFSKGMAVYNGWGQSDFMWHLRTKPQIKRIYEQIYQTDDLVVSLDGFSLFVSPKQKSPSWLHIDQNPKNKIYSIQGSYNYLPVTELDAGFTLIPKSHLTFKPEVEHQKDWIMVDNKKYKSEAKKLLIPENCFTLWNSKLIHANQGLKKKHNHLNRLTCYLTYLPSKLRSDIIREKRKNAYLQGETTSHWSHKCEVKKYPWGFGPRYESRGFQKIEVTLENGNIPRGRLELL